MTENIGSTKGRLTKRGKVVAGIILTITILALLSYVERVTTPAECRVPTEQMSQGCLDLLFPN